MDVHLITTDLYTNSIGCGRWLPETRLSAIFVHYSWVLLSYWLINSNYFSGIHLAVVSNDGIVLHRWHCCLHSACMSREPLIYDELDQQSALIDCWLKLYIGGFKMAASDFTLFRPVSFESAPQNVFILAMSWVNENRMLNLWIWMLITKCQTAAIDDVLTNVVIKVQVPQRYLWFICICGKTPGASCSGNMRWYT